MAKETEPLPDTSGFTRGSYLGVTVVIVEDHGDGWVTALWPDRLNPGRSHGSTKPFTYRNGEWWLLWREQVEAGTPDVELPELPITLIPKPTPEGANDTRRFTKQRVVAA